MEARWYSIGRNGKVIIQSSTMAASTTYGGRTARTHARTQMK
eukprot:COSAG05_NODE_1016_length_6185_cov_4.604831_2_plen_42_part_00